MISVFETWAVILIVSLAAGYIVIRVLYGKRDMDLCRPDIYIVCGLMFWNVYAQVFSLFYKTGAMSCLIMFAMTIAGMVFIFFDKRFAKGVERASIKDNDNIKIMRPDRAWIVILTVFGVLAMAVFTSLPPVHTDTALYHAQAIRWVEDYGIVPGLGNIHFRFAYNSAFMPLQALFSFKWTYPGSLHTMNGFACCCVVVYSLWTNRLFRNEDLRLSDLLKLAAMIYVYKDRLLMSSPNSDTLVMLLVLYICFKWSEFVERDVEDAQPYTCLCVLSVWAVTLKLSAAACVILAIYPLILFIKQKQYKKIVVNVAAGLTVAVPWLIRNVIISGYLLYPYSKLDLFNFDWEMPASVADYDAMEIKAWGRGLTSPEMYDWSIGKWFPIWFENAPKCLVIICAISVMIIVVYMLYRVVSKKVIDVRKEILYIYSIAALFSWFFSSPNIRYGRVYLYIPICVALWLLLGSKGLGKWLQYGVRYAAIFMFCMMWHIYMENCETESYSIYEQADYIERDVAPVYLSEDVCVWIPDYDGLGGYDNFPFVPGADILSKIELRGESLKQGFRIKGEYKDAHINGSGREW